MKPKTLMLLTVAGGCGLVAMLAVQQAMQGGKTEQVETIDVLVALEAVETGAVLTEDKVTFQARSIDTVPEDAILTREQFAERGARVPLFAGDIVTMSKLTEPGGVGNSMKIPKGMRVVTIPVTETNTHSNLVSPGDRVDVLVTYQARNSRGPAQTKTKTLLEYVEVFATGAKTQDRAEVNEQGGRTNHVSLLLMPQQVNYVKLAESKGNLSLSWRHRLDDEFVQIKDIDEDLLEELEGTMGINERPLYADQYLSNADENLFDIDEVVEPVHEVEEVNNLLAAVEEPAVVAPVIEEPEVVPPVKETPKWTLHVYNGRDAIPHEFELPEEAVEVAPESGSLADAVRSLWGGQPNGTDAGQETTPPAAQTTN
ncbi:Flp pilus assembly protein CpaB [Thalassoglobus sp. JC818]|uniref:Flp pilus assembly protein CpaB n=1 Tax=Thalassoglobus sp. JC818 TaxID=3232136 RepID=UPI003458DEEC